MLDVDTKPTRVGAPSSASPAERRIMWQHRPAANLDCSFDRIQHNFRQIQYSSRVQHATV